MIIKIFILYFLLNILKKDECKALYFQHLNNKKIKTYFIFSQNNVKIKERSNLIKKNEYESKLKTIKEEHALIKKKNYLFLFNENNLLNKKSFNKKKILIANWKCYLTKNQAYQLITSLTNIKIPDSVDLIISPNCLHIPYLYENIKKNKSKIKICFQDISSIKGFGPYTGEITADTIYNFFENKNNELYTLIGHSERKTSYYHPETTEETIKKLINALKSKLKVILCFGYDFKYENMNLFFQNINNFFYLIKDKILKEEWNNIIFAFEPSFAIGTGNSLSYDAFNECCLYIKKWISDQNYDIKNEIKILYGGSINNYNIKEYLKNTTADGFLIGKASLDNSFIDTINIVDKFC